MKKVHIAKTICSIVPNENQKCEDYKEATGYVNWVGSQ